MIYPTLYFKHFKVRRALTNYPLYDVPNKQAEATLDEARVQDNFDYFMKVRLNRLAFFQKWLNDWFGVKASLNGEGLLALNSWAYAYGGGLIGDQYNTARIFATYQPPWVREYAGYNVMVDIGIFVGEYLIAKRPKLHWEIYRGHPDEDGELTGPDLSRPCLAGFPRSWRPNVFGFGRGVVATIRCLSRIGHDPTIGERDLIIKRCRTWLALANVPDDGSPYIFGDYSNEPI